MQLQWTQVLKPKPWVKLSALIPNSSSSFLQPLVSYNFSFTAVCSLKSSSGSATPQFWLLFASIGTRKLERMWKLLLIQPLSLQSNIAQPVPQSRCSHSVTPSQSCQLFVLHWGKSSSTFQICLCPPELPLPPQNPTSDEQLQRAQAPTRKD